MEKSVVILNEMGLHAIPTVLFVKNASQFESKIFVQFNGKSSNAKSVIGLMSLEVKKGDEIKILADGEDAPEAISKLTELVKLKFGE
ncbi:HPr family phosphocarrier protein [Abyssisolibacter fermentans]|uniref:HPr family phosphocarrier protein n=1 Tax=Abyssisolibacter fermentans TaxID=1766203 RepID=UPI00082E00B8|nr:HPr family phosphocarrier protein [Abyssisolibacter fermentans]